MFYGKFYIIGCFSEKIKIGVVPIMHAIIKTGGKQYKVKEGDTLKIEKIKAEPGSNIDFDQVLMVAAMDNIQVGAPILEGSKVTAEVVSQGRGKKVHIIKFKRRKHHMKRMGHRQYYTEVKITGIIAA